MPATFRTGGVLLGLFVLSGFAGLVYQSLWAHYLGLQLGHAAHAQTLVLAIFMGGMALGAWAAARWASRLGDLVRAYAIAEALIGLAGLGFHALFVAWTAWSQGSVLPALPAGAVPAWQWGSAALLILPQCILLGATFPLLSAGWMRIAGDSPGRVLGGLYFANSFGAAVGVLAATYWLLPRGGLPGAMAVAGAMNLLVAVGAWWLARWLASSAQAGAGRPGGARGTSAKGPAVGIGPESTPAPRAFSGHPPSAAPALRALGRRLLWATALSGAFSFVYEIAWIRQLNQALGTTLHSFELMLAAFVLGLAGGGLWVRLREARIDDAVRWAGLAQLAMAAAALLSALAFSNSFLAVEWLLSVLPRDDAGWLGYNLGSAAIALVVMFPAAFFAGMTLPLFTLALLREGAGEGAIGRIYAANTLGAIAGVALAVHLLVPHLGLHLALVLAALGDAVVGLWLLASVRALSPRASAAVPLLLGVAGCLMLALGPGWPDPLRQLSGVYRTGVAAADRDAEVRYYRDGRTASIGVLAYPSGAAMIATNGKPDASLALALGGEPMPDEVTMLMAASLPLAAHAAPRQVAVIGWGSGLTTHTLMGSPGVEVLETIEIERAMVEGARQFGDRVARAYADPRSRIVIDDARTRFAAGRSRYDVIISEPSNPWVSGVAHLFTEEFYGLLHRHLADEGLLLQWLQAYEIDDRLLSRMVVALLSRFPGAEVYLTNDYDLLFLARRDGEVGRLDLDRLEHGALPDELARVGLAQVVDYRLRRIGGARVLSTYASLFGGEGHSDYRPVLALEAPRTRFLQSQAELLQYLVDNGLPVLDLLDGRMPPSRRSGVSQVQPNRFAWSQRVAMELVDSLEDRAPSVWLRRNQAQLVAPLERLLATSRAPVPPAQFAAWSADLAVVARYGLGQLPAVDHGPSWLAPEWLADDQPARVVDLMAAYAAAAARDAASMRTHAVAVLDAADQALAPQAREQMLVIAQLGAVAMGAIDEVAELEHAHGRYAGRSGHSDGLRRFIAAWVAGES